MFVDEDDPEWGLMWTALKAADGDTVRECPETGQCWQYMGTASPVTPESLARPRHRVREFYCGTEGWRGNVWLDTAARE